MRRKMITRSIALILALVMLPGLFACVLVTAAAAAEETVPATEATEETVEGSNGMTGAMVCMAAALIGVLLMVVDMVRKRNL